ncbi:hypothetical protein [Leptospira biflexa]|uniref:hypothetical protein n=1 Tax=Leptospira biflexa TaxID=172 RepID=UPI00108281A7|nr:hypothetical protein [Leptospira biflexa]TGM35744.1 hypothetical protein EHQ89_09430 [Leptospira biflexa]TGM37114.1 hypothetical protein EHQ80_05810 [Leptospira biflexa]
MQSFSTFFFLFIFFLTSCNDQSTNKDLFLLAFLNFSGVPANSGLEDKFQSTQATTFYRKDGSIEFQDILIEYKLISPQVTSETVEAFIGNPNEISYDAQTNQISGFFQQKEDSFQTNSVIFSYSDHTKKFKVLITVKRDGKVISLRELTTTPPNPPTIPPNSITLPLISYETKRSFIGGTEHQVIRVKFESGSDLSAFKQLNAYIGRPSIIALAADQYNVNNYISASYFDTSSQNFLFLTPELNSSYKIIVVGSTADAKGNRSIDTVPPPPPVSPCLGSVNAPTTIGNCATHCMVVDLVGNQMTYTTKATIQTATEDYLYLDSTSSTVSGNSGPAGFTYVEFFSPITAGTYQTNPSTFDVTSYHEQCVVLSSYFVQDGPNGFRDHYLSGKVFVP